MKGLFFFFNFCAFFFPRKHKHYRIFYIYGIQNTCRWILYAMMTPHSPKKNCELNDSPRIWSTIASPTTQNQRNYKREAWMWIDSNDYKLQYCLQQTCLLLSSRTGRNILPQIDQLHSVQLENKETIYTYMMHMWLHGLVNYNIGMH